MHVTRFLSDAADCLSQTPLALRSGTSGVPRLVYAFSIIGSFFKSFRAWNSDLFLQLEFRYGLMSPIHFWQEKSYCMSRSS